MRIGDPVTYNGQRCVVVGFRRTNGTTTTLIARIQ